mmetsp:Transcript_853/g.1211  ORF Transcript_853/g.1211 Transcript_853/m.1211 type:complete len:242 (+) Transcript_853:94-819(+)|eukprot:CAMPEP_0118681622 /NCGR_PEP_ID=MMETSP0800-20121206/5043_1 /TAXON_ID=210618 ORGANISM="Striatella unipunctata, Strain CCMP2910" /NCGR_SAMPLE_ID=MMETSP0800 /ASSEMBLY_ACC=CAM_ASM_000638 /LENGTH=241 /DNA_ID=CAMNT_0006577943 /DNA_START=94 /DNA_END=819 /DNA_ORIENTATION=+
MSPPKKFSNSEALYRAAMSSFMQSDSLWEIPRKFNVSSRKVKNVIDSLTKCQSDCIKTGKEILLQNEDQNQVSRWICAYVGCSRTCMSYTLWEQREALSIRLTTLKSVLAINRNLASHLICCFAIFNIVSVTNIKGKSFFCAGRKTFLSKHEEPLMVAKAEIEGAHGMPCNCRKFAGRLNELLLKVNPERNNNQPKMESILQYTRRVIQRVNRVETGNVEYNKKTRNGEIKLSGLSNKRTK